VVAVGFALLALSFPDDRELTPASSSVSFIRDTGLDLFAQGTAIGVVLFVLWAYLMISATSNGVNLTDGLDGLATGASVMVFAAYVLIGVWQFGNSCANTPIPKCYEVRDPLDLAVVAAAVMGACFGFLWWNASPAKIFMGDTGSLALGGALAGLAILSRTELLLILLGGLFVLITVSVIVQVGFFKMTGRRVLRMAPLQHHFELKGWGEVTIVIRFWIIAGLCVASGLAVFYAEWVVGA
jgi:phospho-N-acetylmuramoyl-pentapeptide-transferase